MARRAGFRRGRLHVARFAAVHTEPQASAIERCAGSATAARGPVGRALLPLLSALAAVLAPHVAAAQTHAAAGHASLFSPSVLMLFTGIATMVAALALAFAFWRHHQTLQLGRIMESLPMPRLVVDPYGRIVVASQFWCDLLGKPEGSLDTLAEKIDGEYARERFRRLREAADRFEGGYEHFPVSLPGMSFARVSVHPVRNGRDLVIWNIQDASDRLELERVVRSEQEKLIGFIENAPIGFYSVDGEGRFLYANSTFADWLGVAEPDLANGECRLRDFLPDNLVKTCPPHSPLPDTDADGFGESRFVPRGGEPFDAYVTQTVVIDEGTGGLYTRSLVRHLSGERRIAEEMRVSEERFRRFFLDAPVGIALLDGDGHITECNRALSETSGRDCELSVGRPFADLISPSHQDAFGEWLTAAYDGLAPPAPLESSFGEDEEVAVSLYVGRAEAVDGERQNLIVHVFDLSDQRRIEAQFFQSQKMELVGQLAGGVAHDFNNLLTAMIGFCDLLLLRHTPRDQSFADIQQIKQNANRAANLVRQLLAFSRQQTLQPKVVDLTEVLSETSYLLRRLIGATIELKFYHGRDLWLTKADQGQLEQVVINLAVNARDAMPDGGTLTIRTGNVFAGDPRLRDYEGIPDGDYVLLEMQDTGTGIPPDIIEKIFEPFFTTKEVGAGTGLGLSTVYGIVKQSGGYVFVDSEPGHGARFSIYLPRYREEEEGAVAAAEEEDTDRRSRDLTGIGTVLLVEDEDAVRLFGARALRNKGYSVIEAKDGDGALELLDGEVDGTAMTTDGQKIDLLITDVVMPGIDGPTLVREIRDRFPALKVIFISGYTEDTFRQKLGEGEVVEFLSKPFTLQQLAGKVKEVMDGDGSDADSPGDTIYVFHGSDADEAA